MRAVAIVSLVVFSVGAGALLANASNDVRRDVVIAVVTIVVVTQVVLAVVFGAVGRRLGGRQRRVALLVAAARLVVVAGVVVVFFSRTAGIALGAAGIVANVLASRLARKVEV